MLTTRAITDRSEIDRLLPRCIALAREADSRLPFNYMDLPLQWWDHFNCRDGEPFGKKRGRNFLGAQSWLEGLYLLVTECESKICGAVPFVSYSVRLAGGQENLRVLSFAGDSLLIAFQDFLVLPSMRAAVLLSMFTKLSEFLNDEHDLIFMGYVPEESANIPTIRELGLRFRGQGLCCIERINARRGGAWPWTVAELASLVKTLLDKIHRCQASDCDLDGLLAELQESAPQKLFFPSTRHALELRLQDVAAHYGGCQECTTETKAISDLLSPKPIIFPYIALPSDRDSYRMALSKATRRYFRRYKARFEEQGGSFERIGARELTEDDINDYLCLHSLRWGEESASLRTSNSYSFHKRICFAAAEGGYLTLFFARFNGVRIAVHSCFDIYPRREGYITGRDPQYGELRASRLLYLETIYDAIDNKYDRYELGHGGFSYKLSFTDNYTISHSFFLCNKQTFPDLDKIFSQYEYMGLAS